MSHYPIIRLQDPSLRDNDQNRFLNNQGRGEEREADCACATRKSNNV